VGYQNVTLWVPTIGTIHVSGKVLAGKVLCPEKYNQLTTHEVEGSNENDVLLILL